MKKIAILLAGLCVSGAALADQSVRIINAEPADNMNVTYQVCEYQNGNTKDPVCGKATAINIQTSKWGKNFVDISFPADNNTYLAVSEADINGTKTSNFGPLTCTGGVTGDAIILNSFNTANVVCDAHVQFSNVKPKK